MDGKRFAADVKAARRKRRDDAARMARESAAWARMRKQTGAGTMRRFAVCETEGEGWTAGGRKGIVRAFVDVSNGHKRRNFLFFCAKLAVVHEVVQDLGGRVWVELIGEPDDVVDLCGHDLILDWHYATDASVQEDRKAVENTERRFVKV